MSQSVNRGEKPAAPEAAADAVESVEAAAPAESVEQAEDAAAVEESEETLAAERPEGRTAEDDSAEGGDADDTPTLNLDEESQDDPDEEPGAEAREAQETAAEAVEAVKPAQVAEPAESIEQAEEVPAVERPEDGTAEGDSAEGGDADDTPTLNLDEESQDDPDEEPGAEAHEPQEAAEAVEAVKPAEAAESAESIEQAEEAPAVELPEDRATEGDSAEGGDADGTPTLNLDGESQDEPVETAESVEPAEETSAEAQEGEPAGTVEAVKPAQVAEAAQPAAPAESAVPVEPAESVEHSEESEEAPAVVEQPEEKDPATEAAEPVATPASTRVVDEAATPAEALSPYESAGADAAEETRQGSAWSPDSGDMPPSIAPKSLSGASPSAPAQATPAVNAARAAEPTEGDADPVGDNAAAAVAGTLAAAEKAHKPSNAQDVAKKTNGTAAGSGASRRRPLIPAACAAGAAALLLAWGGIAWWTTQHIASGTTVSGVDVSGLSPKEARDRVGKGIGDQLAQPVTLTVGQGSSELVPAKSGISVDTDASVKKLTGFTLNPLTLAQRLGGQRTEAVIRVDSTALRGALEDRVDTMANGAVSATVTLEGTKPVTTPASNGIGLDVEASLKQLSGSWPLGKKTLAMAEGTAIPAITDEEAAKFVDGTLTPLLSSGLTVNTAGTGAQSKSPGAAAAFSPQDTAEMLKISSEGGNLSATFDPTALRDGVVARVGQVETPAQNATWKIDGSATGAPGARPQYVPAAQGKVIDTAALSASLLKAGTTATDAAGRTVTLPMVVAEPTVTTPQNEWGISETIGEFATPYNAGDAPRTQNLTRGAELVNGTVVKPGEVFSLEKTLGEVDYEHGFADAGVISNGQHVDSLGGGLSQVATTVFNAGFEAGMDDTEHHAHQYYFDRSKLVLHLDKEVYKGGSLPEVIDGG
ncbi:VanW family protein, partial [Propionibacterium acidifaciens]|uniref:VanW family protein n=1 Tax=Propionibacterium acidifaciens TaxID=556499 RepID=UPI00360CCD12